MFAAGERPHIARRRGDTVRKRRHKLSKSDISIQSMRLTLTFGPPERFRSVNDPSAARAITTSSPASILKRLPPVWRQRY